MLFAILLYEQFIHLTQISFEGGVVVLMVIAHLLLFSRIGLYTQRQKLRTANRS